MSYYRCTLWLAFLTLSCSTAVLAQEGSWKIYESQSPEGFKYDGGLIISKHENTIELSWMTSLGMYNGIGFMHDGKLIAGWGSGGFFGVSAYDIKPDGTLDGVFTSSNVKGSVNKEKVMNTNAPNFDGTFDVVTSIQDDGGEQQFTGKLKMKPFGEIFTMEWSVGGVSYSGIGFKKDNKLYAGWGLSMDNGVMMLSFEGESKGAGTWANKGAMSLGEELLKK